MSAAPGPRRQLLAIVSGSISAAAAILLWPDAASAADRRPKEAKVAVELRVGPYRPSVDDEFGGDPATRPYRSSFGTADRFLLGLEVDWEALHIPHFASLGVGGSIGYTKATGYAGFKTPMPGEGLSGEQISFTVWPMAVLAVLRVDVVARETFVPLVPYVKVGPGVGLWISGNGLGTSRASDGKLGEGASWGYEYALGAMFLLDALDRQAAKTFSVEQGVSHSYLFGEYTVTELNGFGSGRAMNVGAKTWNFGFALEL